MNFGVVAPFQIAVLLIIWCLPILAVIWFLKTFASMADSLREIAARLQALERAIRDETIGGPPPERR